MTLAYVMIGMDDVESARPFYDAIMPHLGGSMTFDYAPNAIAYTLPGGGRLWINKAFNGQPAHPGNGQMVGLLCPSQQAVHDAHAAALAHGGTNEGEPGPRPHYGPNFYGAYVRDPAGNKMSFVFFGDG